MDDEVVDPKTKEFEQALERKAQERYLLRLYVTGLTANSTRAIENVRRICEKHLQGRYDLKVIDLYQHPEQAREMQVIAAPTLIKQLPLPLRKIIGSMSDQDRVLVGLELLPKP